MSSKAILGRLQSHQRANSQEVTNHWGDHFVRTSTSQEHFSTASSRFCSMVGSWGCRVLQDLQWGPLWVRRFQKQYKLLLAKAHTLVGSQAQATSVQCETRYKHPPAFRFQTMSQARRGQFLPRPGISHCSKATQLLLLQNSPFKLSLWVFPSGLEIKDLALSLLWLRSLLWCRFHPWLGNFCMLQV